MAWDGRWTLLNLAQKDVPPLYVKHDFSSPGYGVALTDLRIVWEERLSPNGIVARADSLDCPINPHENEEQLQILLQKIGSALNGSPDTHIIVVKGKNRGDLELRITAPLPAPLPELVWTIALVKQEANALTSHVIHPLILNLQAKQQGIANLQGQLHDKDRIIARLLDRLESSGTDLTTVFPGTSNVKLTKRSTQRSQLAKVVKGLNPFDIQTWQASSHSAPGAESLLDVVGVSQAHHDTVLQDLDDYSDTWWSSLATIAAIVETTSSKNQSISPVLDVDASEDETEDEDFQVQQAPIRAIDPEPAIASERQNVKAPAAQSSASRTVVGNGQASTTVAPKAAGISAPQSPTSKDELDVPASPTKPRPSPRKFGRIGGSHRFPSSHPDESPPNPTAPGDLADQPHSQAPASKARASHKLGIVGGRRTQQQTAEPSQATVAKDHLDISGRDASATTTQDKPRHQVSMNHPHKPASRGRSASPNDRDEKKDSVPRETSQERADRRRDELKRQLASQPQGAAKKRRKF